MSEAEHDRNANKVDDRIEAALAENDKVLKESAAINRTLAQRLDGLAAKMARFGEPPFTALERDDDGG